MIKLFYTGAEVFSQPQTLASNSLGGYISNTTIPNGVLNSLFTPLSILDFYKNKKNIQYIGLGLYLFFFDNEESYENVNLKFKLSYNGEEEEGQEDYFKDLFTYKVGLGPISGDITNGYYIEKITSASKPYYMLQDFKVLEFDTEVEFENVNLNQNGVGVWLCREFNSKRFKEIFGFEAEYWEKNDNLPNLEYSFNLDVNFSPVTPVPSNPYFIANDRTFEEMPDSYNCIIMDGDYASNLNLDNLGRFGSIIIENDNDRTLEPIDLDTAPLFTIEKFGEDSNYFYIKNRENQYLRVLERNYTFQLQWNEDSDLSGALLWYFDSEQGKDKIIKNKDKDVFLMHLFYELYESIYSYFIVGSDTSSQQTNILNIYIEEDLNNND